MDKIILKNHRKDLTDVDVLIFIKKVMQSGKISKQDGKPLYCFITKFEMVDNVTVSCRLTKTGTTVFTIW